ncbi:Zn-dependent exopeptidase, partial [Neoconidiobolus thromboides FSU 785]
LSNNNLRLIKLNEKEDGKWLNEAQIFDLIKNNINFFDITEHPHPILYTPNQRSSKFYFPTKTQHNVLLNNTFGLINQQFMQTFLSNYSSFHNRYYKSNHGLDASVYLKQHISLLPNNNNLVLNHFNHSWLQPSVIAKLPATNNDEIIVIGAHLDSINSNNPSNGKAPGADDDGSGVTTLLETLRLVLKSNLKFQRNIEFQFYSAEEVGLLGSQDIAQDYSKNNKKVIAMLQLDMTGYNEKNKVRVINDYTNVELTQYLKLIIQNYSTYPWFDDKCGYACSDHASFNRTNYPSCRAAEDVKNFRLHTENDTTQFLNYNHMAEFVKISLGFIFELANP